MIIRYANDALLQTNNQLKSLSVEDANILGYHRDAIKLISQAIAELKIKVVTGKFTTTEEEIRFFKEIKPKFFSKLIYHAELYNMELKKPVGNPAIIRKYLNKKLDMISYFFKDNLEFYQYYRAGLTDMDEKIFVRGNEDIRLRIDVSYFEGDPSFSTSHDHVLSRILANELLSDYLHLQLEKLDRWYVPAPTSASDKDPFTMKWTDAKAALIELIYALHCNQSFNNGKINISDIASVFQDVFHINLGDYHRKFLEIKSRKINHTKYLDQLKEALLKKINEDDED